VDQNGAYSSQLVEINIVDKEIKIFEGVVINETK
jgi:hypothetical protein